MEDGTNNIVKLDLNIMKRYIIIVFSFVLFFATSCRETEKSTFIFTYTCGGDLLEFMTPTATFKDAQEVEQCIELSKDLFKTQLVASINGDSSSIVYWQKAIVVNSVNVSRDMTIKYVRKQQHPDYSSKQRYWMMHSLNCRLRVEVDGFIHDDISIDNTGDNTNNIIIKPEEIEAFLTILENDSDYCKKP